MQPTATKTNRPLTAPSRVLAFALVWLVFGLSLISSSPEAHAFVHRSEQASAHDCDHAHSAPTQSTEHVCAVVLFAGGVELPAATYLPLPTVTVAPAAQAAYAALFLPVPRYLRQPERGPPAV
ncbi:MAG TPA: hypothetical protein VGD88_13125 [Opitutaceae bacterium]